MKRIGLIAMLLALVAAFAFAQFPDSVNYSGATPWAWAKLTRPNNNTAYAANDMVNDSNSTSQILVFKNLALKNGNGGIIKTATIVTDTGNATNGLFRLLLFTDSVAVVADNAQFSTSLYTNRMKYIGYVDFNLQTAGTSASVAYDFQNIDIEFLCKRTERNLYGVLIALQAYTPGRYQNIHIGLRAVRF